MNSDAKSNLLNLIFVSGILSSCWACIEKGNSNYMSRIRERQINLNFELGRTQNRLGVDCSKVESVI